MILQVTQAELHRKTVGSTFATAVRFTELQCNANPSSMKAALTSFKKIKGTRHIAVLGDMLELGEYAEEMHLDLLPYLEGIDKIYTVGPLMQRLFEKLPEWQKGNAVSKASDILSLLSLEDGDIVCIKGSNGSYVHKITDELLKGKK